MPLDFALCHRSGWSGRLSMENSARDSTVGVEFYKRLEPLPGMESCEFEGDCFKRHRLLAILAVPDDTPILVATTRFLATGIRRKFIYFPKHAPVSPPSGLILLHIYQLC